MIAILLKDVLALKQKGKSILLFLGIAVLYLYMFKMPALIFSLTCVFLITNVTNLISTDKEDNGLDFTFSLPISRVRYVAEKYALILLTILAGILFSALATYLFALTGKITFTVSDLGYGALIAALISIFYCAVTTPLTIKFTPQELRPIMIIVMVVILILANGSLMMFWRIAGGVPVFIDRLLKLHPAIQVLLALAISALMLGISFFFSLKVLNGKRFARK